MSLIPYGSGDNRSLRTPARTSLVWNQRRSPDEETVGSCSSPTEEASKGRRDQSHGQTYGDVGSDLADSARGTNRRLAVRDGLTLESWRPPPDEVWYAIWIYALTYRKQPCNSNACALEPERRLHSPAVDSL